MDENLKEEKYNKLKESVKTKVSTPHDNLKDLHNFTAREIEKKTFYFNRKEKKEIDHYLNAIQVDDLKKLWAELR